MKKSHLALSVANTLALVATLVISPLHVAAATTTTYINGKLAYHNMASPSGLYMRNGDGSNPVLVLTSTGLVESPSWSPNGKQLLYSDDKSGAADIYKANYDGSDPVDLTNNPSRDEGPAWSPDGTKIAYVSDRNRSTADYRLWLMDADGSNEVDISDPASTLDRFPKWSPDGKKIYYSSSHGGVEQVYAYDLASQTDTQVTHFSATATEPVISPDGTKVLFAYVGPGDSKLQLYIENVDGTGFKKLFQSCSNGFSEWPTWSPDGTKIAFISDCADPGGNSSIYMINSDGTGEQRITTSTDDDWGEMDWQRVPVASVDDDKDKQRKIIIVDTDHHDIDYEVYVDVDLTVNGRVDEVIVHAGGTLKGHGHANTILVEAGAHLAPGNSPGCINGGDLNLASGSSLDEQLGGTTACSGYDQTVVTGTVTLGNATLNPTLYGNFVPKVGDAFTIISNDGNDSVSGTFSGLAEGVQFTNGGVTYAVSYKGGDGNDVVLTVKKVDLPGAPDTGMKLASAQPVQTLVSGAVAATALLVIARTLGSNRVAKGRHGRTGIHRS